MWVSGLQLVWQFFQPILGVGKRASAFLHHCLTMYCIMHTSDIVVLLSGMTSEGRPNTYCMIKCLFQVVIKQQCEQIRTPHFGRVIPVLLLLVLVSTQDLKAQSKLVSDLRHHKIDISLENAKLELKLCESLRVCK